MTSYDKFPSSYVILKLIKCIDNLIILSVILLLKIIKRVNVFFLISFLDGMYEYV